MYKKIEMIVDCCRHCPHRSVFRNTGFEKDDWVCSKNQFIVIPDINEIPEWCPLPNNDCFSHHDKDSQECNDCKVAVECYESKIGGNTLTPQHRGDIQ